MNENQLLLDIDPAPIFKVSCRFKGEMQTYEVEAMTPEEARQQVVNGVTGAYPVLALVQSIKH